MEGPIFPAAAYAALLRFATHHNLLPLGRSLHRRLLPYLPHHPHLSNHLITLYSNSHLLPSAHQLFDEMPLRNLFSYSLLISAYSRRNLPNQCFLLFSSMLPHHLPNEYSLSSVLSVVSPLRGRQVHALAFKTSFDHYTPVCNALISMYSNSPDAWAVFRTMPVRNIITWNSIIAAFPKYTIFLFQLMLENGFIFDRVTLVNIISTCRSFRACLHLHCVAIKSCFDTEASVASALVKAYSGLGGGYSDC